MSAEGKKTLQKKIESEVFISGDCDKWDMLLDKNVIFHNPPNDDVIGIESFRQVMKMFFEGLDDRRYTTDLMIAENDTTAELFTFYFRHTGLNRVLPVPPSDKEHIYKGVLIAHWRNGKISEMYQYTDLFGLYQQLGIIAPLS